MDMFFSREQANGDAEVQAHRYIEELQERHYEELYRYIRGKVPDKEDAEDLVQECFARACEHVLSKRGKLENERAWLYGVAKHCLSDFYKRRRRCETNNGLGLFHEEDIPEQEQEMATLVAPGDVETEVLLREELCDSTEKLKTLSPKLQKIGGLLLNGYNIQEISDQLHQPASTTRADVARFRKLMDDYRAHDDKGKGDMV